jgi:hypothetical protein
MEAAICCQTNAPGSDYYKYFPSPFNDCGTDVMVIIIANVFSARRPDRTLVSAQQLEAI